MGLLSSLSRGVSPFVRRKRVLRAAITVFLVLYTLVTLAPFYFLAVRTFVQTKDATDLPLWIPPKEEIDMQADIGNLAVFYNLDLQEVKEDLGIPLKEYLNPKWSLSRIAREYDISEESVKRYFAPFFRYGGWLILFGNERFWPAVLRTFLLTGSGIVGINILSILTGTALAGLRRRDQILVYNLYLLEVVIPPFLIILPQFMLVQWILGLVPGYDSPGATRQIGQLLMLILIYIKGFAVSTMIFTSYIATIPHELEEAAEIDGASRIQYIRGILLPLMKVPVGSLTVIMLPWFWNDFLQPFIYLDAGNTTLLPLIQSFTGQFTTNFQVVFTGAFVSIIPLVAVYVVFRKWFIQGALAGAVKG